MKKINKILRVASLNVIKKGASISEGPFFTGIGNLSPVKKFNYLVTVTLSILALPRLSVRRMK